MCGIAGIFHLNGEPASVVTLRKMTDAIAHRGPDGEGFYTDSFLGLGHRRLAIIDLSPAGHQPMLSEDGRYVLTYNGEVYNFLELRAELEAAGCRFRSRSDTEVVLHAFATWGPDCVRRFNGMFAFAVWDKREHRLHLARDRYGVKPLYYAFVGPSTFIFGSEQKALLAFPELRPALDREGLLEYFTFQNFFTDRTLLRGIRLFPPATTASIALGDSSGKIELKRYWDFDFREPETARPGEEYVEELDRLLRRAVQRQLVSDVPVGTYLSGGVDSGAITAFAAAEVPYINSFTCGFDLRSASGLELSFDEREKAEHMSYLFKTEHYEMVLKSGDMERVLPRTARAVEEPRLGQSYPNYCVANLASKFVKVVLSGLGGDELFGGYPWRYYRAIGSRDFDDYIDRYYLYWQRLIPNALLKEVFAPIWEDVKHVWTRDIFKSVFLTTPGEAQRPEDWIHRSLYFEARTFLHSLFILEDKLSMAHGLETRVPFLDNDLVDFTMRLPVRTKLREVDGTAGRINENEPSKKQRYGEATNDGKLILKRVLERHLPRAVTGGNKQGFSSPDASWFRGESIEFVRRVIHDPRARIFEFLAPGPVQRLVDQHLEGKENRRLLIWSLLNFESWLKAFLPQ